MSLLASVPQKMITILKVQTPEEALVLTSKLEANGISVFLADLETVSTYILYSDALGGIRLMVPEDMAERALEILDFTVFPDFSKSCPNCNSTNISYLKLNWILGVGIFFDICLPINQRKMYCNDCLTKFKEKDVNHPDLPPNPDFELFSDQASQAPSEYPVPKVLPLYFRVFMGAIVALLVATALTPIYYMINQKLPTLNHFLAVIPVGILLNGLLIYTDLVRSKCFNND